jgi:hypothetical protein
MSPLARLLLLSAAIGLVAMTGGATSVSAQSGPNGSLNPQRDCQTVRSCRFTPGGSFRGCISAYSCRTCRFVSARCTINGEQRLCREMRCGWGV